MTDENVVYKKTRKEALEAGEVFYFTRKPCKRGHISKRHTKSRSCVECRKTFYREKNLVRNMSQQQIDERNKKSRKCQQKPSNKKKAAEYARSERGKNLRAYRRKTTAHKNHEKQYQSTSKYKERLKNRLLTINAEKKKYAHKHFKKWTEDDIVKLLAKNDTEKYIFSDSKLADLLGRSLKSISSARARFKKIERY